MTDEVVCSSQRSQERVSRTHGEKPNSLAANRLYIIIYETHTWESFVENRVSRIRVQVQSHIISKPIYGWRRITGGGALQHGVMAHFDRFVSARALGDNRKTGGQIFF